MVDEKLVRFLRVAIKKGYSKDYIKKNLIKEKWPPVVIDEAFNYLNRENFGKKPSKKPKFGYNLSNVLFWIIIIIIIAFIVYFAYEKNCGYNKICFQEASKECKPAKVYVNNEDNIFLYKISGLEKNNCIFLISVEKIGQNNQELKNLFEGKSMTCKVPKEELVSLNIIEEPKISNYCTGPLKEAMYELIIKKLYSTIAQNLGPIYIEMEKALNKSIM